MQQLKNTFFKRSHRLLAALLISAIGATAQGKPQSKIPRTAPTSKDEAVIKLRYEQNFDIAKEHLDTLTPEDAAGVSIVLAFAWYEQGNPVLSQAYSDYSLSVSGTGCTVHYRSRSLQTERVMPWSKHRSSQESAYICTICGKIRQKR